VAVEWAADVVEGFTQSDCKHHRHTASQRNVNVVQPVAPVLLGADHFVPAYKTTETVHKRLCRWLLQRVYALGPQFFAADTQLGRYAQRCED